MSDYKLEDYEMIVIPDKAVSVDDFGKFDKNGKWVPTPFEQIKKKYLNAYRAMNRVKKKYYILSRIVTPYWKSEWYKKWYKTEKARSEAYKVLSKRKGMLEYKLPECLEVVG